ncbi:MAG: TonB-dependent receptor family protein [Flavobacteriaceae bacterium]|nr:TonB-dependent receptor [Candidatus Neomarinimicrobiota bacterium]|tara:strand:- start:1760 stop:3967 length:2208 start_codon:yes stop_codon:yes gene_type:complete
MRIPIIIVIILLSATLKSQSQPEIEKDSIFPLDEVIIKGNTILGNKYVAKNRTGAAYYFSTEELGQFDYADINRALSKIPGINLYEEDGFGLRPNISIRGTSPERSSKIAIMEDGVLISPAPYSASSAYYFPSVARMQAIEVLKGSSQIQYGPYTTGGAINFVSTEIPDIFRGKVTTSYGSFQTGQLHATFGDSVNNFGYMLEYLNFNSNGFKSLGNNLNTGFDINEITSKIRYKTPDYFKVKQSLEFKFHHYDEISNETYLGLTESDFEKTPHLRYAGSEKDKMDAEHVQYLLTHEINFSERFKISSNFYHNGFKRNWYKLDDVVFDGSSQKISKIISNPSQYLGHISVVKGALDSDSSLLKVKANNREYVSRGAQTKIDYHWYGKNNSFNDLEIGFRLHYDEEDRFQWEDIYNINNGFMSLETYGDKGSQGNRISSANTFASYIMYKYKVKGFTISPGIRYESIKMSRDDFGKSNPLRNPIDVSSRENKVSVFIPGVGFNYTINNKLSVFSGIHKGFSPPGNSVGQKAEESINLEAGVRFSVNKFNAELIAYQNDYSNLLGNDLAASGGTGELDPFNAGEALVNGLEVLVFSDLIENKSIKIPFLFSYTLTNAKFLSDFGSTQDIWGVVSNGDRIPYIPKHQLNSTISLQTNKFELHLNANYNGKFSTIADGSVEIPAYFILDASLMYRLSTAVTFKSRILNILDESYAVSRAPAGLRPGHPFGVYAGFEVKF